MKIASIAILLVAASHALPQGTPAPALPTTGDNGEMGGIFGMGSSMKMPPALGNIGSALSAAIPKSFKDNISSLGTKVSGSVDPNSLLSVLVPPGPEYPKGKMTLADFYSPGSGPYPAHFLREGEKMQSPLANHTVYAPKTPPPSNVKMPVLIWGNGGCTMGGTSYAPFLTEVASYGYLAIANGSPGAGTPTLDIPGGALGGLPGPNGEKPNPHDVAFGGFSSIKDMNVAIDWVLQGNADKYGNIDKENFITAGSSCGGLEAYSAAYHNDKVKLIGIYNSGVIDAKKKYLLKEIKAKVALVHGGPNAIEYQNALTDYTALPQELPVVMLGLDTGHMGTFFTKHGGKYGAASVALFESVFRNNQTAKTVFTDPKAPGSLVSQNWNVTSRNFF